MELPRPWGSPRVVITLALVVLFGGKAVAAPGSPPEQVPLSTPTPVRMDLPVVPCATSYGLPEDDPPVPPPTQAVMLPAGAAQRLSLYGNGVVSLLGPKGWSCTSAVGADGSTMIAVYPATTPPDTAVLVPAHPRFGVVAYTNGACQGCAESMVCPYFPEVAKVADHDLCDPRRDKRERLHRLSTTVVAFWVPPGVTSTMDRRSRATSTSGVVIYFRNGDGMNAAQASCTLPHADHALCDAILDDYVAHTAPHEPKPGTDP